MRVSYQILKRFLPELSLRPEEVAEIFLNQGFVVEEVLSARDLFLCPLLAGTLVEARCEGPLTHCTVKLGEHTFRVLVHTSGVPETGSRVLVGLENHTPLFLPVRGERAREVFDFLLPLPPFLEEGDDVYEALIGDDVVFEVEITANRGDCLSVLGLARELAAHCDIPLVLPEVRYTEKPIHHGFRLENEAPHLCPLYTGRYVTAITVRPSPFWIAKELILMGMRPINNVVDITNLVMLEMGQPLHAFDAARIRGNLVRVREAEEGERLMTLDGEERVLKKGMLLIADADRPIALAGVMGGRDTEVGPKTREIFLEAAFFDRVSVRRTARALGMRTEASARFERGVDPLGVMQAASRALALLEEAGGEVASGWLVSGQPPFTVWEISVPWELVVQRLSCEVSQKEGIRILERLGFQVAQEGATLRVRVPSWRPDVREPIDVVEEIGRVYGYGKILSSFPSFPFDPGNVPREESLENLIRAHLVHRGLYEVVTLSLVEGESVDVLGFGKEECVAVLNPLSQEHAVLRPSLFLSLFEVVRTNARRGRRSRGFFEVGKVFFRKEGDFREEKHLGVILWNVPQPALWKEDPLDLFTLKGFLEEIGELAGVEYGAVCSGRVSPVFDEEEAFVVPSPEEGTEPIGWGGKVLPAFLRKHDVEGEVYYLEIRLEGLATWRQDLPVKDFVLPAFPAVSRDISVVVDASTPWAFVASLVAEEAKRSCMALEEFVLFDVFSGDPLPPGKKGFAFRLVFRAPDRTLEDEEVGRWVQKLKEVLKQTGRVVLREEMILSHE